MTFVQSFYHAGSDQSICSVTGAPPSLEYVRRRRRRSLAGGGCITHVSTLFKSSQITIKTYPLDTRDPHLLLSLLSSLQLRAADGLQLQLL